MREEVEYRLTVDDARAFRLHHLDRTMRLRPSRRCALLSLSYGVLFASVLLMLLLHRPNPSPGVTAGLLFGIALLVVSLLSQTLFRHRIAACQIDRWFRNRRNRELLEKQLPPSNRLIITPEAVAAMTPTGMLTVVWKAVEDVCITHEHAFIYLHETEASILPRSAFPGAIDFETFTEKARRYWQAARATDSSGNDGDHERQS
jgi:hypothetical protein